MLFSFFVIFVFVTAFIVKTLHSDGDLDDRKRLLIFCNNIFTHKDIYICTTLKTGKIIINPNVFDFSSSSFLPTFLPLSVWHIIICVFVYVRISLFFCSGIICMASNTITIPALTFTEAIVTCLVLQNNEAHANKIDIK